MSGATDTIVTPIIVATEDRTPLERGPAPRPTCARPAGVDRWPSPPDRARSGTSPAEVIAPGRTGDRLSHILPGLPIYDTWRYIKAVEEHFRLEARRSRDIARVACERVT